LLFGSFPINNNVLFKPAKLDIFALNLKKNAQNLLHIK